MDFNDSPEEAAFRAETRAWLKSNAKRRTKAKRTIDDMEADDQLTVAKGWQGKKAKAGYACIDWPKEYGGRGLSRMHAIIYDQEELQFDVPRGFFGIGLGTCAPAIMAHGTEAQKKRYLPKMATGEEVWCQLFSEPACGSDLAGLRTRAERDGDEWVVNGQKVWNSGAHYADWGILVTRHDPDVAKHKGLTFFVVDMKSRGIEARPIKQIPGASNFNEVFLQNVRIPDRNRLDEVGAGWQVAITTLMNERHSSYQMEPDVEHVLSLVREIDIDGRPALDDPAVREQLAEWWVQSMGVRNTYKRTLTAISKGRQPGPENSIGKVVKANQRQQMASFGADLQDMGGAITGDAAAAQGLYQLAYLAAPGMRIAAGTDEILRNIIAERVLGLPGDIRLDRDRSFKAIPTGKH